MSIDIRNFKFYTNKNIFTGSYNGVRFSIEPVKDEEGNQSFLLTTWPEPFEIKKTDATLIERKSYSFTPDSLEEIKSYIEAKADR